jgi:hypothetical protein
MFTRYQLGQMRWSAHANAVNNLASHYRNYINVFHTLTLNTKQNHDVRSEANSSLNLLERWKWQSCSKGLWNTILQCTNEMNK